MKSFVEALILVRIYYAAAIFPKRTEYSLTLVSFRNKGIFSRNFYFTGADGPLLRILRISLDSFEHFLYIYACMLIHKQQPNCLTLKQNQRCIHGHNGREMSPTSPIFQKLSLSNLFFFLFLLRFQQKFFIFFIGIFAVYISLLPLRL